MPLSSMLRFVRPVPGALLGLAAASVLAWGCGDKKTETTPTPQTPASGGAIDWTISGTLVANPDAQPIGGASITVTGGAPVTSNPAGQFSISGAGRQPVGVRVSISATGYVRRDTSIQAGANRSGLVSDLIRDAAPFSLTFYRELARGSLDGAMRTTRRWHQDPSFYIQTIDE